MKILLDRRLTRLVKFVTIDPSELHFFFKTKRVPQIHMSDTLLMSLKETPASLFIGEAATSVRQIYLHVIFANFILQIHHEWNKMIWSRPHDI